MRRKKSGTFKKRFVHNYLNDKNYCKVGAIVVILVNTEVLHVAYVI